jgi:hypothetical protein
VQYGLLVRLKYKETNATAFVDMMCCDMTSGSAPNGNWNPENGQVNLNNNDVGNQDDILGARPAGRIYCRLFSHPPSMRPMSPAMAVDWKTLV